MESVKGKLSLEINESSRPLRNIFFRMIFELPELVKENLFARKEDQSSS